MKFKFIVQRLIFLFSQISCCVVIQSGMIRTVKCIHDGCEIGAFITDFLANWNSTYKKAVACESDSVMVGSHK